MNGLSSIWKMAKELTKDQDVQKWEKLITENVLRFNKSWQLGGQGAFGTNLGHLADFTHLVYDGFPDQWAEDSARLWLLNSEYGFMPPNDTWAAPLAAHALNSSEAMAGWSDDPWLAHSTFTWETTDGLYRHHVGEAANAITLGHIRAMQRTYGFTVFPEAWDAAGLPWGDQWYNWGGVMGTLLPLEGVAGVSYTLVKKTQNASKYGILTVCDNLPGTWTHVNVSVPIRPSPEHALVWVGINIQQNAQKKTITVSNNPLGTLQVQPWLQGKSLKSAEPSGFQQNWPRGHIGWQFTGDSAKHQSVTVLTSAIEDFAILV